MNVLLVYPKFPDTYWSFKHAVKFISKKAVHPPLGLITIASLLPVYWNKQLVDVNVSGLTDRQIKWADYIMISAMSVQRESAEQIIERCNALNKIIIAGGPLFTEEHETFRGVDHFVLNEAEITLPQFITDVIHGNPKQLYQTSDFPDIQNSPLPDYSLLKISKYASMSLQYTRGCPYDCEFCDITALYGRKVRHKSTIQIIRELNALFYMGWRGSILFVDDNFIGNKHILKKELLPAIIDWMERHHYPFNFSTEASIDLADDKELIDLLVQAGFNKAFIGIETPDAESLLECNKSQNRNRNMVENVNTIHKAGIEVTAGFIVGFDNDKKDIFQRQIDFIQKSNIISAMVGLLNAPKSSKLFHRLTKENRILHEFSGNNTDYNMNFIPKMNKAELLEGYQRIITGIYSSKAYYQRVFSFLKNYEPPSKFQREINMSRIMALVKSILLIGILKRNRKYYWKLFFWSLIHKPNVFPLAITFSIYGYHYQKVFKGVS